MTTIWQDGDIPTLLQGTGAVPCTIDGVDGIALMDWNDELLTGDPARAQVIIGQPMLTIQTSAFPAVKVDSVVVIDGKSYTVRERLKYGDGGTTKLFLGPPPASKTAATGEG
jgi:hypothetical protein